MGQCKAYQQEFSRCKMNRDARISRQVTRWEAGHFAGLSPEMRAFYLRGLGFKLDRMQGQQESSTGGSTD